MRRRPIPSLLLAAACALLMGAQACAQDSVLHFGYASGGYPPYLFPVGDGQNTGIIYDVLSRALDGMGWTLAVEYSPELRGQMQLDAGLVDCRGKALEWVDDPGRYQWSDPLIQTTNVLITRADRPPRPATPQGLDGCSVATLRGYSYPVFEKAFRQGAINRVDKATPEEALMLVSRGRVEGAFLDEATAAYLLRICPEYDACDFRVARLPFQHSDYRLMFSPKRDWKPFIREFNARLAALRAEGAIERIFRAYR